MEKDFAIDKVRWYTLDVRGDLEPRDNVLRRFRVIIDYLQHHSLTTRVIASKEDLITDETAIMVSDLTEEGMTMIKKCHDKWLRGIDRGKDPSNLKIWDKALAELRSV